MSCDDAKLVIVLKALIIIGVLVEYFLGKRTGDGVAKSGADLILQTTRAALVNVIFLVIVAIIKFKQWRDKK